MAIAEIEAKLLWARAAGICSNPACRDDLTVMLGSGRNHHIGEMAHVIARSPGGPRGADSAGSNLYENLILLCPTCHTKIDKAPAEYPEALLRSWKSTHEAEIRNRGKGRKYQSIEDLRASIEALLDENRSVWSEFGPNSRVARCQPASNLYKMWDYLKLSVIVKNNTEIINAISHNVELLSRDDRNAFLKFKNHAAAFEMHQFERLDDYPRFPPDFEVRFRNDI